MALKFERLIRFNVMVLFKSNTAGEILVYSESLGLNHSATLQLNNMPICPITNLFS